MPTFRGHYIQLGDRMFNRAEINSILKDAPTQNPRIAACYLVERMAAKYPQHITSQRHKDRVFAVAMSYMER